MSRFCGVHHGAGGRIRCSMETFLYDKIRIAASAARADEIGSEIGGGKFDLVVLSHAAFDAEVDLFDEICGKTNALSSLGALSERTGATVVAGLYLCYGGIRKLSAAVAAGGELADIADSCSASEPYTRAGTVKVYNTGRFRFAVLPGGDARVRFIMEKLRHIADLAVCLEPEYRPENEQRVSKLARETGPGVLYVSPARIFLAAGPRPLLN